MPDNFQVGKQRLDRERRTNVLDQGLKGIHKHSHIAARAQKNNQEARQARHNQESDYSEFNQAGLRRINGYFFLILAIPAAYFMDFVILNRPVEYLVGLVFPEESKMMLVAKILMPLAILGLELYIATQLYFALVGEAPQRLWKNIAHCMVIVMPVMVIVTFVPQHFKVFQTSSWWIYALLLIALTILAGITHALVIFGGETAYEARSYFWFLWTNKRYRRIERQQDAKYRSEAAAGYAILTSYINNLNTFNRLYPEHAITAGPFDDITYRIMNQWAGYEILQRPGKPNNNPPHNPAPSPPNTPPTNNDEDATEEDGKNEYLRTILSSRIRSEESEVRP
ncbi:hypothetical protein Cri9333_0590 [Crinalium epipsammum PCC 9333]|uniref:Uncharacterized protein n=1 Tax=Crinalium epipsammum PCC 9333 TaxID=1173022 RepID=K9VUC7_9CYAN|nr:hypothetical protein [Crinalium epipsammum]AFZ11536.1 hypothetical protein Cri9333_0590 [Crinalium epipsammum PCC 9333]